MTAIIGIIAFLFYYTWFIWPFIFVFSLLYGVVDSIRRGDISIAPAFAASISLAMMLGGTIGLYFSR